MKDRRQLRRFGVTIGVAFLILTAFLLWKDRGSWPIFCGLGGLSLLLAAVAPMVLGPVERVWMKLALAMGWVMTRVILGVVFLVMFVPAGLIIRLLRRDPIRLRFDSQASSYWLPREPRNSTPERMERMF